MLIKVAIIMRKYGSDTDKTITLDELTFGYQSGAI